MGDLVLRQPLEILQLLGAGRQVGLTGHDTGLDEEGLLAVGRDAGGLVDTRLQVVVDVVAGGVETNHPGVHIDTCGLGEGALSSLDQK